MSNVNNYLFYSLALMLLTLSSCQTPTAREIARYIGRPNFGNACVANGDGTCFENGELRNTTNMICGDANRYDLVQSHLEDIEFRLYRCLKNPRRCR